MNAQSSVETNMNTGAIFDPNKLRITDPPVWLRMHHLPPMGYVSDFKAYKMIPDPILFPQLRKVWEMVLAGIPIDRVRVFANQEMGVRTPTRGCLGGKPIARGAFYRILTNPFYAGAVRVQGQLSCGLHEPMVSIEEFMRVREMLQVRRRNFTSPSKTILMPPLSSYKMMACTGEIVVGQLSGLHVSRLGRGR